MLADKLENGIARFVRQKRYEILLISFLLLIFGNAFIYHVKLFDVLNLYQNMIVGLVVYHNRKYLRLIIFLLLLFAFALDLIKHFQFVQNTRSWHSVNYLLFFLLVSVDVFKELLYTKKVSRELLAAALCGFVLLCLMCTFVCFELESFHPRSFSNLGTDPLMDLNYFSFVTLLTTGYGDIVPLTHVAKRTVMFIGLLGHFYTVFVTSIIIGKYLAMQSRGT